MSYAHSACLAAQARDVPHILAIWMLPGSRQLGGEEGGRTVDEEPAQLWPPAGRG